MQHLGYTYTKKSTLFLWEANLMVHPVCYLAPPAAVTIKQSDVCIKLLACPAPQEVTDPYNHFYESDQEY